TRTSTALLDQVSYRLRMNDVIDSYERRDDPLINNLFATRAVRTTDRDETSCAAEADVHHGCVVNMRAERGFAFVRPDDGSADRFFHANDLSPGANFSSLQNGMRIAYRERMGDRQSIVAYDVRPAPAQASAQNLQPQEL